VLADLKLAHEDLVARMRSTIASNASGLRAPRDAAVKMRSGLADAAERFEVAGGGENLLADMVRGQLAGLDREIAAADAQIAALQDALEALKSYSYRRSPQVAGSNTQRLIDMLVVGRATGSWGHMGKWMNG